MTKNAQTLIARAMRTIGALGQGDSPEAAEAQDALEALNDMVDTWKAQKLTIPTRTRSTYALTSGTQEYTIGDGATFDQERPEFIEGIGILLVDSSTIETQLHPYTEQEWREKSLKTQDGTPSAYYYNPTFPNGVLTFWPVPDATDTVAIYWLTALTSFADLTTNYSLAPAVTEALHWNLAVRLAPEFGKPLQQIVVDMANDTLATMKRLNKREQVLRCDPALTGAGGHYNIYADVFE